MNNRSKILVYFLLTVTLFALTGCNLPSADQDSFQTRVAGTVAAENAVNPSAETKDIQPPPPENPIPTLTATLSPTVTLSPTLTLTPTITLTATLEVPMVSVSVNTNCRTGPDKIYDNIGALMVGEQAEVVGQTTGGNYWIIKNPDANGTCWLWGQYATVAGNTSNLQEYAVPPTPTPEQTLTPHPPSAPKNLTVTDKSCTNFAMYVTLTWTDTSDNEDGFILYIDGTTYSFVFLAANQTQTNANVPYTANVPVEFRIASYNTADKSGGPSVLVTCP